MFGHLRLPGSVRYWARTGALKPEVAHGARVPDVHTGSKLDVDTIDRLRTLAAQHTERLPDNQVEGVLDLAFEDDQGWTIVDFKTTAQLAGRGGRYRRQVAMYARLVRRATGRAARAVRLRA